MPAGGYAVGMARRTRPKDDRLHESIRICLDMQRADTEAVFRRLPIVRETWALVGASAVAARALRQAGHRLLRYRRLLVVSMARSPWKPTLWSFGLGSLVALGLVVAISVSGWFRGGDPPPAEAEVTVYTRGEFTSMVMGKSEVEVLDHLGKPDRTATDSDARYWHYKGRTKDPVSGETDTDAQLVFRDGRVTAVTY